MAYFSLAEDCFKPAGYISYMPLSALWFKNCNMLNQQSILQMSLSPG
jgi:hypothetical protein